MKMSHRFNVGNCDAAHDGYHELIVRAGHLLEVPGDHREQVGLDCQHDNVASLKDGG